MITCKYLIRFSYSNSFNLYVSTRSTVAVNLKTRQRLKKLCALLDLSQGEIIKKALDIYENFLFHEPTAAKSKSDSDLEKESVQSVQSVQNVQNILKKSLLQLWEQNPDQKALDLKLMTKNEDFDKSIIDDG